jgi:hypothetical protein
MTYYDAWLRAPDTFGETATAWLPPEHREAFFYIRDGIKSGRLHGEQVDHLTWRATVTPTEIEALLAEIYGPPGDYEARHDGGLTHLADRMRTVRAFIAALPPDQDITIMADEF